MFCGIVRVSGTKESTPSSYLDQRWLWSELASLRAWFLAASIGISLYEESSNGLLEDCGNSGQLALELLQSCTKPSI